MEDYIVGFRAFGNSWAYISEVMPGKDGEKVYIYGTNNRKKALEAMMLLMRGDDAIAVKYASEWYVPKGYEDELAYLAAIGVHFDSVEKVVPTLKKLEVPNAAR